ncbi:MAG TPA: ATP synthase F1 subunit delta [Vicinamibacteria bacterium]
MRAGSRPLARRYARALLEVSLGQPKDGAPEKVRGDLEGLSEALREHKELGGVLQNPAVGIEAKKKIAASLGAKAKVTPIVQRLLALLAARDRMSLLPLVAEAFVEGWNAHRGVTAAEAVTAVELPPAQSKALAATLGKAAGREVELEARVDPRILGGLVVRMGGKTYDGSVRGRLVALRETLLGRAG